MSDIESFMPNVIKYLTQIAATIVFAGLSLCCSISLAATHDELLIAIENEDKTEITSLLDAGVDINGLREADGMSALGVAVMIGDESLVSYLIAQGANANLHDPKNPAPIHYAVELDNQIILEQLLKAGAEINELNPGNSTPFQIALYNSNIEMSHWLLKQGANVNKPAAISSQDTDERYEDDYYESNYYEALDHPIFLALDLITDYPEGGDTDAETVRRLIQAMVAANAKLNVNNESGETFVFSLLNKKDQILTQSLLPKIKNLSVLDEFGNTVIHKLIKTGQTKLALSLINKHSNPETLQLTDKIGFQAIDSAYDKKQFAVVTALLKYVRIGIGPTGSTLLHRAYEDGYHKEFKQWLNVLDDIDISDANGNSLLHLAVQNQDATNISKLIEQGASSDKKNNQGQSPLLLALTSQYDVNTKQKKWLQQVKQLLNQSDLSLRYDFGQSLLHLAAASGDLDLVKLIEEAFLNAGISTGQRDKQNRLAAHIAINHGHKNILEHLTQDLVEPTYDPSVQSLFTPLVEYWSLLYWAGRNDLLQSSVEAHLASSEPNPLAAVIWVTLHDNLDRLAEVFEQKQGNWNGVIDITSETTLLASETQYQTMVDKYPPSYDYRATDLFALINLASAAASLQDEALKVDYLEVAMKIAPNFWQMIWSYEYMRLLNKPEFRERAQKFAQSNEIKDTLSGQYLEAMAEQRRWGEKQRLHWLDKWLAIEPNDPRALTSRAFILKSANHHQEALLNLQKSLLVFPFYANANTAAELLLKLDKPKQARRYLTLMSEWYSNKRNKESAAIRVDRIMAELHQSTGDKGRARKGLERLVEFHPKQVRVLRNLASLERADGRYTEEAQYLDRLLQLEGDVEGGLKSNIKSDDYESYIHSLIKQGEMSKAQSSAKNALASVNFIELSLFSAILDLADDVDNQAMFSRVYDQAIKQYPDSVSLLRKQLKHQWQAGEQQLAMEKLDILLLKHPENSGLISDWKNFKFEVTSSETLLKQVQLKVDAYYWNKTWWTMWVDLATETRGSQEKNEVSLNIWQQAQLKNNDGLFALDKIVALYVNSKQYAKARAHIEAAYADLATKQNQPTAYLNHDDIDTLFIYQFWTMEQASKRETLASNTLNKVAVSLEDYRHGKGNLVNYYRYKEAWFRASNNMESAAKAMAARAMLNRDETSIYHDLVADYASQLTKLQVQGYGYHMLKRNPYDKNKLASYLHKQLLWQGSPINALKAIEAAKQRGVSYNRSYEKRALNNLGDTLKLFESYSLLGTKPGDSKRYIQWFDSARADAMTKARKEIVYDFKGGKSAVKIVLPNGEVVHREDHPIFGNVVRYQKAASFIEVGYSQDGHMQSIVDSSGQTISLVYNDQFQIEEMRDNEDRVLNFLYTDFGKPKVISIEGEGSLHVSYDAAGEIDQMDSEDGHRMALKVTQAFQDLSAITKRVQNVYSLKRIPALAKPDPNLDRLRNRIDQSDNAESYNAANLTYATYLVEHISDNADYFDAARKILQTLFREAEQLQTTKGAKKTNQRAVAAIELWHQLFSQVKTSGLPVEDYSEWARMKTWLTGVSFRQKKFKGVLTRLEAKPFSLLKDAKWLATANIQNTAYWKRYGNESLYTSEIKSAVKQAILVRANGDIVLASNKGLSVLRSGFWEWFGFDERASRFSHTAEVSRLSPASDILSLSETDDRRLWIGTAKGLFALDGDYDGSIHRWQSKQDGLDSPRINSLAASGNRLYIGTAKGLLEYESDGDAGALQRVKTFSSDNISAIAIAGHGEDFGLIVNSNIGLNFFNKSNISLLTKQAKKMAFDQQNNVLYWLDKERIYSAEFALEPNQHFKPATFVGLTSDLLISQLINEFSIWPVKGEGQKLIINTDLGINILKDHSFQAMELPFEVGRGGVQLGPRLSFVNQIGDIVIASDDGIYSYQPSLVRQIPLGRVYDSLIDEDLGLSLVATGSDIRYLPLGEKDQTLSLRRFSTVNAKFLRHDKQGNLITNDGLTILRFSKGEDSPQQLFSANQNVKDKDWRGNLNDILVASDNTIWVAAGSSLFRYETDSDTLEEFNYFINPETFPSRSQMIYRVFEDTQGDIYAIASNESHLNHKGVDLTGGVLAWRDGKFVNIDKDDDWFVTAYTKINEDTAIVGTNGDFLLETNGRRDSFSQLKGTAYETLKTKSEMIWLGQKGAQLGDDNTWVFPSAGGVVVYHEGSWFYPDKLNQLLIEDQALGQYGARTVHNVSISREGDIYIGTDLGLLIYQSNGVASLLNDHHRGQIAFTDLDTRKRQRLDNLFMENIDPESDQGKLLAQYQSLEQEIEKLKQVESGGEQRQRQADLTSDSETIVKPDESVDARLAKLKLRERRRQKLLANLERKHSGLYQMLKLDPREIGAMHKKLNDKQALIQYMPVKDKLLIQVVTHTGAVIKEVKVEKALLEKMSLEAAAILRTQVKFLASFTKADDTLEMGLLFDAEGDINEDMVMKNSHIEHLSWLYHHLLRPIENELAGKDQIFITPVGKLTYVPFSALIRQVKPKIQYAIDKYNIGILPSMYHFNMVMQQSESFSEKGLFVSDPDGSLPGARREVTEITASAAFETTVLEGEQASLDNLLDELENSKIIHFATHGVLKPEAPEDSYLLLADRYQFNVIDISLLDLEETGLVVLSACESGVGISGLEYATLARAFALAKVPSVIASFWEVDDSATRIFMNHLYRQLAENEDDNFLAMGKAKKDMLKGDAAYRHPAAWASFEIFGKP